MLYHENKILRYMIIDVSYKKLHLCMISYLKDYYFDIHMINYTYDLFYNLISLFLYFNDTPFFLKKSYIAVSIVVSSWQQLSQAYIISNQHFLISLLATCKQCKKLIKRNIMMASIIVHEDTYDSIKFLCVSSTASSKKIVIFVLWCYCIIH